MELEFTRPKFRDRVGTQTNRAKPVELVQEIVGLSTCAQHDGGKLRNEGSAPRHTVAYSCCLCTVSFAYNDTRQGIRKVSLFAKCRYTRSIIICITVTSRWDFSLGMGILSLFAVVISEVDCTLGTSNETVTMVTTLYASFVLSDIITIMYNKCRAEGFIAITYQYKNRGPPRFFITGM